MKALLNPARFCGLIVLLAALLILGCGPEESPRDVVPTKKVAVSSNVNLEVHGEQRRVLIEAVVCQREGALELLLTHQGPQNKAYEAILSAAVEARDVYDALIRANAKPGSPVQFDPEFREARGQRIKVSLRYEQDGKQHTVPAQSWIRTRSGQPVQLEWVFAGSRWVEDAQNVRKKQLLAQEEGTLIGLGVSEAALLDVNIRTAETRDDLDFNYWTEHIPPEKTKVTVILEPMPDGKDGKK